VKRDGYPMLIIREDKRVRLITKDGHDRTKSYPRMERTRRDRQTAPV
jgi:ATP-dependent DNA ligase